MWPQLQHWVAAFEPPHVVKRITYIKKTPHKLWLKKTRTININYLMGEKFPFLLFFWFFFCSKESVKWPKLKMKIFFLEFVAKLHTCHTQRQHQADFLKRNRRQIFHKISPKMPVYSEHKNLLQFCQEKKKIPKKPKWKWKMT